MKKAILLTIWMVLLSGTFGTANAIMFDGHDYVVVRYENQSWGDAASHLSATLGSDYHLATIDSAQEQDFIVKELLSSVTGEYWLGGYQGEDQAWNWTTGEAWGYTNWAPGEANDFYGRDSEQYMAIWDAYGAWGWNDEGNLGNITGFIAESAPAPVPEPATLLLLGCGLIGFAGIGRKKLQKIGSSHYCDRT